MNNTLDDVVIVSGVCTPSSRFGGAIAIGHPVGASGGRILMPLMYELRRRGGG
jgi:acetyl-CoA C-acetyltransferase